MRTFELEDLTLFLIRDADEAEMWIDRWAVSYPVVQTAAASASQSVAQWQANIKTAFEGISGEHIAVVAHGAGVSAFLAWLYLGSPRPEAFPDDEIHTLRRVRCPCRTALVIAEQNGTPRNWAEERANLWNARLLLSPHSGTLNGALGGWQWGMKLMQEMLLS